jgi:hypothetical protein
MIRDAPSPRWRVAIVRRPQLGKEPPFATRKMFGGAVKAEVAPLLPVPSRTGHAWAEAAVWRRLARSCQGVWRVVIGDELTVLVMATLQNRGESRMTELRW